MNRKEALDLVREYTKNENLVKHMLAVEAAMIMYAEKFGEPIEEWSVCGLLHDFDYEKMGTEHPSDWGYEILREKGVSENVINAIKGHADRQNPESRPTRMDKTLFAVDELTGFIVACALVNPERLSGLKVKSILKKFKKKDFAKAVSREDMYQGAEELGVDLEEHIQTVLDAMVGIKEELGL
jgi:putative nucleotidyltransferase with HDIG domain